MTDSEYLYEYERMRRIVREKEKFKKQVIGTIGISLFLFAINLFTAPGYIWAMWPILAMTLSLILKGMKLYGPFKSSFLDEDDMIQRELNRNNRCRTRKRRRNSDYPELPAEIDNLTLKSLKERRKVREGASKWREEDLV